MDAQSLFPRPAILGCIYVLHDPDLPGRGVKIGGSEHGLSRARYKAHCTSWPWLKVLFEATILAGDQRWLTARTPDGIFSVEERIHIACEPWRWPFEHAIEWYRPEIVSAAAAAGGWERFLRGLAQRRCPTGGLWPDDA